MFIKRLFCRNHKWVAIKYTEYKDDTDRVIARETIYECKNCGKKNTNIITRCQVIMGYKK